MIIIISRGKGIDKYKKQFERYKCIVILGFRMYVIYGSDIDGV